MTVQLHISLSPYAERHDAIQIWFENAYLPALRRQSGFQSAVLLAAYPEDARRAIDAMQPPAPLAVVIEFDSEANRAAWQFSTDHETVWPHVEELAQFVQHVGWQVVATSDPS